VCATPQYGFASCRVHVLDLKQRIRDTFSTPPICTRRGCSSRREAVSRGEVNEDIFNVIRFNSRLPERTIGDLQAQVSACVTGVRRTQAIAAKYGVPP